MPAWRLDNESRSIRRYDVATVDSESRQHFVQHIVLSLEQRDGLTQQKAHISAVHMGPPCRATSRLGTPVHAIGTVGLDAEQSLKIKTFADERLLEYKAQRQRAKQRGGRHESEHEYVIHPPAKPPDSTRPFWRFSCAGFVLEAYRDAGIKLVDRTSEMFPVVTLDELKEAFPHPRLDDPGFRQEMGLEDDGPWPVVLAGYVINAFNREADDVKSTPHVPIGGDQYFPARPTTQAEDESEE